MTVPAIAVLQAFPPLADLPEAEGSQLRCGSVALNGDQLGANQP